MRLEESAGIQAHFLFKLNSGKYTETEKLEVVLPYQVELTFSYTRKTEIKRDDFLLIKFLFFCGIAI